jgi:excisionase family DNA binding protein
MQEDLIGTEDAANILDVSSRRVRALIQNRRFTSKMVGGTHLVSRSDVMKWKRRKGERNGVKHDKVSTEDFIAAWNSSDSVDEVMVKTKLRRESVNQRVYLLRKRHKRLKKMGAK